MTVNELDKKIEALAKSLSQKELEFVDLYLANYKPATAAVIAGLAENGDDAVSVYSTLLNAPKVKMYIDALKTRSAEKSLITLEEIDKQLMNIATTDVCDVMKIGNTIEMEDGTVVTVVGMKNLNELSKAQRLAISSIKPTQGGVEVKFESKLKALESLIKRRGGYTEVVKSQNENIHVFANVPDNGRGPKNHS